MAVNETSSANVRGSHGSRRPVTSNIGVRRRQLPTQERSATTRSQRLHHGNAPQDRRALLLDRRDLDRTDRSQNQHESSNQDLAAPNENGDADRTTGRGSTESDHSGPSDSSYGTSTVETLRGSSDGKSPLSILVNPKMDILPVAKTQQARASFDFYVNSYVTSIIEVSPRDIDKYTHVIHQILHDEMLFTSFTTCSEAARWRTQSLHDDAPLNVVRGYGKTISLLSDRLRSGRFAMSPTVLLTMGQLVAIETLTKNVSATAKHLAGMQSAMAAKAGAKAPAGSSPVQAAVDIWGTYFGYRAKIKATVRRTASVTYPGHPFPPNVTRQISELPTGFANVTLSRRLSVEMLDLMEGFNAYFIKINQFIKEGVTNSAERTHIVLQELAYCIEYAQIQTLSLVERLVLVGLTAYVVRRDRIHPGMINVRNYYQITCANLLNVITTTRMQRAAEDADLFTWIGLLLLLTSTPEAYARKLALKLLPTRPEPLRMLKKCQDFFWDDDLTNALLSGSVLAAPTSNDIIAENVSQTPPESEALNGDRED